MKTPSYVPIPTAEPEHERRVIDINNELLKLTIEIFGVEADKLSGDNTKSITATEIRLRQIEFDYKNGTNVSGENPCYIRST